MGKGIDLQVKTIEVLRKQPKGRFTATEIATKIFEKYPDECREKQESSKARVRPIKGDDKALIRQIAAEISRGRESLQSNYSQIRITDGHFKKYYYTTEDEGTEQSKDTSTTSLAKGNKEAAMYPALAQFLESEFDIYSKRIDESHSSNSQKGANKWLHPDVVAVEFLSQNWDSEITRCVGKHGDKKAKLWSFEVKVQVDLSKLREFFFQTVSNSSWANYGYLVVREITAEASDEMRILSGLHGIGLIILDIHRPSEGRIAIPAKEKQNIDWNVANRLAKVNRDFKEYIKLVADFYKTNRIIEDDWKWE